MRHQKGAPKLSLPLSFSFFHFNCDDRPASDTRRSLKPVRSLVPGSPSIRLKRFHSQNKTCNYRFESSVPPFETPSVSVRVVRCAHARLNSRYKEEDRSRALWSIASPLPRCSRGSRGALRAASPSDGSPGSFYFYHARVPRRLSRKSDTPGTVHPAAPIGLLDDHTLLETRKESFPMSNTAPLFPHRYAKSRKKEYLVSLVGPRRCKLKENRNKRNVWYSKYWLILAVKRLFLKVTVQLPVLSFFENCFISMRDFCK